MVMSRKNKKRMYAYAVGASASCMRGAIKTASFMAGMGLKGGDVLGAMVIGNAYAITDELLGTHSSTMVGDTMWQGCSALLSQGTDFAERQATRGISALELAAKRKIIKSH